MKETRWRALFFGLVALGIFLRFVWPLADPPDRLTWSNGEVTDPPSIVHAARNVVLFGEWVRDDSKDLVFYPLLNGITAGAFRIFGPSRLASVLLSALFGAATVAALAWAIRRARPGLEPLLAAAIVSFSFWIAMFSRIPVAENLVVLLLVVSAGCALRGGRRADLTAGVVAGIAAFFGKIHALTIVPAIALYLAQRGGFPRVRTFVLGGLGAFALWVLVVFIPGREAILDQVSRASDLYGSSPLVKSAMESIVAPLRALRNSWFFLRFPWIALVGGWYAIATLGDRTTFRARLASGGTLFALWVAAAWLALSFLAYQAPRYFLLAAIPLGACAAYQIVEWFAGEGLRLVDLRGVRGNVALFVWCVLVAFGIADGSNHWISFLSERIYPESADAAARLLAATDPWVAIAQPFNGCCIVAAFFGTLAFAAIKLFARRRRRSPMPRPNIAALSLAFLFGFDAVQIVDWIPRRDHALEEAKSSFSSIVGEDAVVFGGFAPALVMDTKRVAIPLFGNPRPGTLEEYGVTHLVLGEPGDISGLEKAFPDLVARLSPVQSWPVRTRHLRRIALFRLRPADSLATSSYVETSFERAVDRLHAEDMDGAIALFEEYRRTAPRPAPDALSLLAECRLALGDNDAGRALLEEAIRERPSVPQDLYNLGVLLYRGGREADAIQLWKRGFRLDPSDAELAQALRQPRS